MRVVSFLPSATEIVAALGHLDALVGVSHECDFPPGVRSRPVVTSSAIDSGMDAGAIDRDVRACLEAGRALYDVRADRVRQLAPDLLVTQAVCDVCAVSEGDVRAIAAQLDPSPHVVTLGATTIEGIAEDIRRVAAALDATVRGDALIAWMYARMRAVHDTLAAARAPRPRVAVVEWTDPVFAAGHWVPEMVRRAGGMDVLANPGERSTVRAIDDVRAADPEIIIVAPCGFDLARATADAARIHSAPDWAWARVREVWAVDANALLSRPGPRVAEGVQLLAQVLHPALFGAPERTAAQRVA